VTKGDLQASRDLLVPLSLKWCTAPSKGRRYLSINEFLLSVFEDKRDLNGVEESRLRFLGERCSVSK